jgi:hypothetical protein
MQKIENCGWPLQFAVLFLNDPQACVRTPGRNVDEILPSHFFSGLILGFCKNILGQNPYWPNRESLQADFSIGNCSTPWLEPTHQIWKVNVKYFYCIIAYVLSCGRRWWHGRGGNFPRWPPGLTAIFEIRSGLIFKMVTCRPQSRSKFWAYCPKVSSHQVSLK